MVYSAAQTIASTVSSRDHEDEATSITPNATNIFVQTRVIIEIVLRNQVDLFIYVASQNELYQR